MTDEQLPDDVLALIAKERAAPALASDASARIAERLSSTLAIPSLPSPATPAGTDVPLSSASSAAATQTVAITTGWTAAKLVPIALAFVLGGASGAAITVQVMKSDEVSTVAVERAPARTLPVVVEPAERVEAPAPATPGTEPPVIEAPATRKPEAAPSERADTDRDLRAERELIALSRRALGEGHAGDALAELEKHDRRFPKGRLAEERDSLRVPALVMLGRRGDAATRAAQFRARYPNSLFAPVVESALHGAEP